MSLIKSLLLGSAAGFVVVASSQAADLPSRKGPASADYVRICSIDVAGTPVVGFVLPGSDTCFKISGFITGQIEGGNLKNSNYLSYTGSGAGNQYIYSPKNHDELGYSARFNLAIDAVSNTAYGPLAAHGEYEFSNGGGFDSYQGPADGGINLAYVTWAGITAGKAASFFSFTGGGPANANFFSSDRKYEFQPVLLAYTASFAGGIAATVSLEDPYNNGYAGQVSGINTYNGSYAGYLGSATEDGLRVPDIVGALSITQGWGNAQVSGVAHNIRATSTSGDDATIDKWGYAFDGGVTVNIPNLSGATFNVTGAWSKNATWYSGLLDGMWGEPGQQVNYNGQGAALADAFYNGNGTWATPTAWTITSWGQFNLNPDVTLALEGSYGEINWSSLAANSTVSNSKAWILGPVVHYDPVKNLDFEFELLYESVKTDKPAGYSNVSASSGAACTGAVGNCTKSWQGDANGFATRFQVTRNF